MRRFSLTAFILLALIAFSCTENDGNTTSPLEPELLGKSDDCEGECRGFMRFITMEQCIFFAENGHYASSLEELGLAWVSCPGCDHDYILEVDLNSFSIHCPFPSFPTHGSVINGVPTWHPSSSGNQYYCHANMIVIVGQSVIFFAENDRYAADLEELGLGYLQCPECGNPYVYYPYTDPQGYPAFYIECGMPSDPTHGYIDNGVASWVDSTEE